MRMKQTFEARIAGALWLTVIVTGMFAFYVSATIVVNGDPAATAANIRAFDALYRLGLASNLVAGLCYIGVTVILYDLLNPIGHARSTLAACFGVAGVAVGAAAALCDLAPLVLLRDGNSLAALTLVQRQALSYAAIGVERQFMNVGMMFFGCQCVVAGWLFARSTLVPRVLGVLLAVGGTAYLINTFATLLWPAIAPRVGPFILPAGLVGEGSLTMWLLVKGVRRPAAQHDSACAA
jgi:hypothetical protein